MRRFLAGLLAAATLLISWADVRAQSPVFQLFTEYIELLRTQAGIPGLAGTLVSSTGVLWEGSFGQQDIDRNVAARTDTPFHVDGLTQLYTAALVLRCVEEGRLSLDDRIGQYAAADSDANLTIRHVLSHTTGAPDSLTFSYRPERLEPLKHAIRACTDNSYRETLANLLNRLAMTTSVPGPDILTLAPPAEGIPDASEVERYSRALERLAVPYAVDAQRRASVSRYAATTLTPGTGLIATVQDFAQFDLALKSGLIVRPDTLAAAWQPSIGRLNHLLPHGIGWFVQTYKGEKVVWQFGIGENASSSLVVTVPGRGLTMILLANSPGLVRPLPLAEGDVTVSPFARLFLGTFVR
jgi:CubicO group peptidase (beta-lactamase class C family)